MPQAHFWVAFKMPSKGPGLSSPPASDELPPWQWRPLEALGFSSPPAVMRCPCLWYQGRPNRESRHSPVIQERRGHPPHKLNDTTSGAWTPTQPSSVEPLLEGPWRWVEDLDTHSQLVAARKHTAPHPPLEQCQTKPAALNKIQNLPKHTRGSNVTWKLLIRPQIRNISNWMKKKKKKDNQQMIDADIKMMAMLQLLDNDFRATIILLQRAVMNVLETTIKETIKSLSKEIKSLCKIIENIKKNQVEL